MKQKLVFAIVISIGLAVLTLSAIAQVPTDRAPGQPPNLYPLGKVGENRPGVLLSGRYTTIQNEEAELASQAKDLVRKLGEAKDDSAKDKIKTKLTELVEKQFDLRQKRHTSQLEELENQVKKLKELVQKRQDNRRDIVSKRLEQLQREALGLGW